jgi:membrane-associated phospholipid phosphatase
MLIDSFFFIGQYGPFIIAFITVWILSVFNNNTFLYYYIIGFFINLFVNVGLKILIQQPRPNNMSIHPSIFDYYIKNLLIMKKGYPLESFGMPSGHVQSVFYSFFFLLFSSIFSQKQISIEYPTVLWIYMIICIITMIQRVLWNFHTILQVFCGAFIGAFIGFSIFWISKRKIRGVISETKPDDNAYIIEGTHPL